MFIFFCRLVQLVLHGASFFLPWKFPKILSSFDELAKLLHCKNIKSLLLVTGKTGRHKELLKILENEGLTCVVYDKTQQNPTVENIEEAFLLYNAGGCTAIVAFGGGSPMDCAKGIGARVAQPKKTISQMRGTLKVGKPMPLFIAIPTTSGTGSETSLAAVITNSDTHEKYPIADPVLMPHYALMEPMLTVGLPPALTAYTGMDALCHAVEAYIGRSNTQQTKEDALHAIALIFGNLYTAFTDGSNLTSRKNMQDAAFLAGRAFTRAYVGNIHAVAHTLGGQYGTQHGLANAVIMPYILEMYGKKIEKQLSEMAIVAGIADKSTSCRENAKKFIFALCEMNAKMGIPDKIAELKREDIPMLAHRALKEVNPFYPVPVIFNRKKMENVYYKILEQ